MRLRKALAWVALGAVVALLPWALRQRPDEMRVALLRPEGFTGVLRLWVAEEGLGGSLNGWLMRGIRQLERAHPGVYVQISPVSAATLSGFASGKLSPPDLLLFPPGALGGGEGLLPLPAQPVRVPLESVGAWAGELRATPVALGGYAWAHNRALLTELPASWTGAERPGKGKARPYLMTAPGDAPFASWSAALMALSMRPALGEAAPLPKAGEGVDLGLPQATTQPTPVPSIRRTDMGLPAELPKGAFSQAAYDALIRGEVAAAPVSDREIRRWMARQAAGRGPELAFDASGLALTDRVALMAVVDLPRADLAERQALGMELIDRLTREDSQRALADYGALPVTSGLTLYAAQPGMAQIEQALSSPALIVPGAFDDTWHRRAQALGDAWRAGELDAGRALAQLIG